MSGDADEITLMLVLKENGRATKRHTYNPTIGDWLTDSYDAGHEFATRAIQVTSIRDLAELLDEIRHRPDVFAIRAQPAPHVRQVTPEGGGSRVRRNYLASKKVTIPAFIDVPRRWLMADFDGVPIPEGLDSNEDIDALIERAIAELLPEPFHDCAAFWQLSASAGIKPGLRVHVWFWLDRPVPTDALRKWMRLNARNVDPALFNAVQVHYTADPIIRGGPDPVPRRTGWVKGERDHVTLPDLDAAQLAGRVAAQRRKNATAAGLSASQAETIEGALAEMGDGAGLRGFNAPLLRASWLYAKRTPLWQRDAEALKATLRRAIEAAPKAAGRDVSMYLGDAYLDRTINGAFDKVPTVAGWEPCAPEHPLPEGTVVESRQRMAAAVGGFMAEPTLPVVPFIKKFCPEAEPLPRRGAVVVETGLGKTQAAVAELAGLIRRAKAAGQPHRVLYCVPEHSLGAQVVARARAEGLSVAHYRAREANLPDGTAMCDDIESVIAAREVGASVETQVCGTPGDGKKMCEFRLTCPFYLQRTEVESADVVVCANTFLFFKLPDEIAANLGFVVVDESFWQAGLHDPTIGVGAFASGPGEHPVLTRDEKDRQVTDHAATAELHAIRTKLMRAFDILPLGFVRREHIEAAGLTAEDCSAAESLEWRRKLDVPMWPGMSRDARAEAREATMTNARIPRMTALWRALHELLTGRRAETGRVEMVERHTADNIEVVAQLRLRRDVSRDVAACPVLMLDATGDLSIVEHFLPFTEILARERPAAPHMTLRQVIGPFSRTSLAKRAELVGEVVDFVQLHAAGEPALVVTHKNVEDRFASIPNVATAHFGAVAGRDDWRGARRVFVIGRPQASPDDTRNLAVQLTGRPIPITDPTQALRGVLMADGSGIEIEVSRFDDPDLEAIRGAVTDAAIVQAVGRGRGINRTAETPLDVWVLGNVTTPWPVSDLVRWSDVALSPIERMAARGAVLFGGTDAAAVYPDLFPSPDAARMAIARAEAEQPNIPLYRGLHKGMFGCSWTEAVYRPAGKGQKARRALIAPDRVDGFAAWLGGVLVKPVTVISTAPAGATASAAPAGADQVPAEPQAAPVDPADREVLHPLATAVGTAGGRALALACGLAA